MEAKRFLQEYCMMEKLKIGDSIKLSSDIDFDDDDDGDMPMKSVVEVVDIRKKSGKFHVKLKDILGNIATMTVKNLTKIPHKIL